MHSQHFFSNVSTNWYPYSPFNPQKPCSGRLQIPFIHAMIEGGGVHWRELQKEDVAVL